MIHLKATNSDNNNIIGKVVPDNYPVSAIDCFSPGSKMVICRPGKKPRIVRIRGN